MASAATLSSSAFSCFVGCLCAGIGEIGGIGAGREAAGAGCMMVVAAGTDDTEAVEALCLDLRLRIPAGSAKLPGAT